MMIITQAVMRLGQEKEKGRSRAQEMTTVIMRRIPGRRMKPCQKSGMLRRAHQKVCVSAKIKIENREFNR